MANSLAIIAQFHRWLDDWNSVADEQWLLAQMAGCQDTEGLGQFAATFSAKHG